MNFVALDFETANANKHSVLCNLACKGEISERKDTKTGY